jgi:hypothetical protein
VRLPTVAEPTSARRVTRRARTAALGRRVGGGAGGARGASAGEVEGVEEVKRAQVFSCMDASTTPAK